MLLLAALAACQTDPGAGRPATGLAAAPGTATSPAAAEQQAARPAAETLLPDEDPAQLIGLDPDGVAALLGRPDLVRQERPAEIWQYGTAACVFDVFLYEETEGPRVVYLEARDRSAAALEARDCFNRVLGARRGRPLG